MPSAQASTSASKPGGSSSKFDESAWYKKWHGYDAGIKDCHRVVQEIFNADEKYWKSLIDRVHQAVSQKQCGLDAQTQSKFDEAVSARKRCQKSGSSRYFLAYSDFETAYAEAKFLKDLIGALSFAFRDNGTNVPKVDSQSTKTTTRASESSSRDKGPAMPKSDSTSRSGAKPSSGSGLKVLGSIMPKLDALTKLPTRSSTKAQGSLMPKLDDTTKVPTISSSRAKGSLMPKLDSTAKVQSGSSSKAQGSLMLKLDSSRTATPSRTSSALTRTGPNSSSSRPSGSLAQEFITRFQPFSTSSHEVSEDGNVVRNESHERRYIPPHVGADGVIRYAVEETHHVNVQEIRVSEQVVLQQVVVGGQGQFIQFGSQAGFQQGVFQQVRFRQGGYQGSGSGSGSGRRPGRDGSERR